MLKYFGFSYAFSAVCLALAGWWGLHQDGMLGVGKAMFITVTLALMEISLSFDNAVVNASVLRHWNAFWTRLFLTVGILIAVFGMRLLFPLLIVGVTANLELLEVVHLALNDPTVYAQKLTDHHAQIAAFGGTFLLMVFANFFFDKGKEEHWLSLLEKPMQKLSASTSMATLFALLILLLSIKLLPSENEQATILLAGIWGLVVYLSVQTFSEIMASDHDNGSTNYTSAMMRGGIASFLYLELLDASFSFDGVIGAFAITNDIVVIMLGLAIGAIFVRSITIFLVEKNTLTTYAYLEHGAHYAIGVLAIIMLMSIKWHVPEFLTGTIGILCIVASLLASIKRNRASNL